MAQAVKGVVTDRARDPRDFVLASFGGAGPMHACFVAQAMGIPRVLIPAQAGVASAFGATTMDLRHDVESFFYSELEQVDTEALKAAFATLEQRGLDLLASDGMKGGATITRSLQMRYVGQTYEVDVDMPAGELTAAQIPAIAAAFHAAHHREYGVSTSEFPVAIVAIGISAVGKLPEAPLFSFGNRSEGPNGKSRRNVFFDGAWMETEVHPSVGLTAGKVVKGPAVIEYPDTAAILPPGSTGEMDNSGNLLVTLSA